MLASAPRIIDIQSLQGKPDFILLSLNLLQIVIAYTSRMQLNKSQSGD
jgi:hypothetical protein